MNRHIATLAFLLIASMGTAVAAPSDEKSYKEGPVTDVSFIRVKDGKMMDYMKYLDTTWKQEQEALKKAGLVTDYHVYSIETRNPQEANLILTVTYPSYGTLDRTSDFDAVTARLEGSLKAADKGFADRGNIRDVLGSELVQEMILK